MRLNLSVKYKSGLLWVPPSSPQSTEEPEQHRPHSTVV